MTSSPLFQFMSGHFLTPFPIYVRSLPHPFSNLYQVTSSPLFQFMSGHFLTPFPIYVKSLPHPFSNLCQVTPSPLFQFFNVSLSNTCRSNQSSEPAESNLRGQILISIYSMFMLSTFLHFSIDVTSYSIVRGSTVPSSNLSRINLPSQSVTKMFAYSS